MKVPRDEKQIPNSYWNVDTLDWLHYLIDGMISSGLQEQVYVMYMKMDNASDFTVWKHIAKVNYNWLDGCS